MSLPRIFLRSPSGICSRSRPSNIASPEVTRPVRARSPSNASDVTLLPHPDSPTMPSVSPLLTSNEMPLTAYTVPRSVPNSTRRSDTESSAPSVIPAQLRIESFAECVSNEVEAEHDEHDCEAREEREQRRGPDIPVSRGQH